METTENGETAAAPDVVEQQTPTYVVKSTSDGYGYGQQKIKKKDAALLMAEKMTWKEYALEFLSFSTTVLILLSLVVGCRIVTSEAKRISTFRQKMVIDRPATSISASNFMVLSNNEYCNYIIELILEQGYSAASAGRVMFMCLYVTVPHLLSPHGQQMYLTVDKWGNITDSGVSRQSHTTQYNSTNLHGDDLLKLMREEKYKIGFSENIAFQRRLYEMSGREKSDEAMKIFEAESISYAHLPVVHDLKEALRVNKFAINPLDCSQYFTSWGTVHVDAELMDQSYLLKHLLGIEQTKCNQGNTTVCQELHRRFYESLREKYEDIYIIENPFLNKSVPPFALINASRILPVYVETLPDNMFVVPNLPGVEKEVNAKNKILEQLSAQYESFVLQNKVVNTYINKLFNENEGSKRREAMVGFLIVDKYKGISMGAGGMRTRAGSKQCHQGAFLDSHNDILGTDTDFLPYHHRFIPVLNVNRDTKLVQTASLIIAEDRNEALQYLFNYIHISTNRQKNSSGHGSLYGDFGKDVRSPVVMKHNRGEFLFVKGLSYREVTLLREQNKDTIFHEVGWDQITMDMFGVKMNSTHMKAYYMDKNGRFAALAAQ